jgi:hypothetical protein
MPTPTLVSPPHPAALAPDVLRKQCTVAHTRGSGPGGQHRNKVSTAVVLTHEPTEVAASASETRSQSRNGEVALFRLRLRLALKLRADPAADAPSPRWLARRKDTRIAVNAKHADFPTLIAEALDAVWSLRSVRGAATMFGVSSSQLVRLLAQEPGALKFANALRAAQGQPALRSPFR